MMRSELDAGPVWAHDEDMANFRSHRRGERLSRLTPLLCVLACNTSGQTGSPQGGAEDPPIYTSPPSFEPGSPTGEGDDGGLGEGFHFMDNPEPRRLSAISVDTLYVFASPEEYRGPFSTARQRGLLIYDISDRTEPKLSGELAIPGHPVRMYAEDGVLTLIIVQPNDAEYSEIPSEPVPAQITRVLQIDVTKPQAPKLTGQLDVPGYTRSYKLPDGLVAISDVAGPRECRVSNGQEVGPLGTGDIAGQVPENDALISLIDVSGPEPNLLDELTREGFHVGLAGDGSRILLGHFIGAEGGAPNAEVLIVEATNGKLSAGAKTDVEGHLTAAYLGDGRAVLGTERAGNNSVLAFSVAPELGLLPLGEVAIPGNTSPPGNIVAAGADAVLVSPQIFEGTASSSWVSFGEELSATHVPAMNLWSMAPDPETDEARFLAISRSESGHATLAVWGADESSKPTPLVEEQTDWPYTPGKQPRSYFDAATGRLLYPSVVYDEARRGAIGTLGTATVTSGEIAALPSRETVTAATGPVSGDATAYVSGEDGISVVPLNGDATTTLPLYPELNGRVVDELRVGETDVTLRHVGEQMVVEFTQGDAEPTSFTLEHVAEELLHLDDSVLVLGLRGLEYCQDDAEELPDFATGGAFECPEPGVVGLTLFDVSKRPKEVWSQPLTDSFVGAPELPKDASFRSSWAGYVMLSDQRLALPMSAHVSCESKAACEALDIVGEAGQGAPGCNPQQQNCDELPAVEHFFNGGRSESRIYTLDLAAEGGPELTAQLTLDERHHLHGEGPLALDDQVLRGGDVLGFAEQEPVPAAELDGDDYEQVAFYLTRADLAGAAATSERINTPGFPLALLSKGSQLLSLEPDGNTGANSRDALLHLTALRGAGAFIEDTVNLGAGYRDHTRVSDRLFLLFGPELQCAEAPESRVFSVDVNDNKILLRPELQLPGDDYSFVWYERPWPEDSLLLGGRGRSGRLLLDVGDAKTAPEFQRFFVKTGR